MLVTWVTREGQLTPSVLVRWGDSLPSGTHVFFLRKKIRFLMTTFEAPFLQYFCIFEVMSWDSIAFHGTGY